MTGNWIFYITITFGYLYSKITEERISVAEAAMIALNIPGSAIHSCRTSSKKLNASLLIVNVTFLVSPGSKLTLLNPFNSFTGRGNDDFEIAGVVRRAGAENRPAELSEYSVVKDIKELKDVDVAILCTPTRSVEKYAKEILALGIHTVDSFDIHTGIPALRRTLDAEAKAHNTVSIISAGWDPGSDSVAYFVKFVTIVQFDVDHTAMYARTGRNRH